MTTDEFVEAVNAVDADDRNKLEAYTESNGDIFLQTLDNVAIAVLEKYDTGYDTNWDVRSTTQVTIPTKILKLMVELAESKEDENKYVILNGKPFLLDGSISTKAFLIIEHSLESSVVSIDDLTDFAYTKEELELLKTTLPKKLQEAVDLLTVTVSKAKKVLKNDN